MDTAAIITPEGLRALTVLPDERLGAPVIAPHARRPAVPSLPQRATPVDAAAQAVASPWATWAEVLEMAGG